MNSTLFTNESFANDWIARIFEFVNFTKISNSRFFLLRIISTINHIFATKDFPVIRISRSRTIHCGKKANCWLVLVSFVYEHLSKKKKQFLMDHNMISDDWCNSFVNKRLSLQIESLMNCSIAQNKITDTFSTTKIVRKCESYLLLSVLGCESRRITKSDSESDSFFPRIANLRIGFFEKELHLTILLQFAILLHFIFKIHIIMWKSEKVWN